MNFILHPWQLLLVIFASWINREQQQVIDYLRAEKQGLLEKVGKERILLNDDQRRRLAVKGKILGRKRLHEVGTLFTPDTILRWQRQTSWKTFIRAHWDVLSAIDFTTVAVRSNSGLVTYYPLFVTELETRRVHFAACTPNLAPVESTSPNFLLAAAVLAAAGTRSSRAIAVVAFSSSGMKYVELSPGSYRNRARPMSKSLSFFTRMESYMFECFVESASPNLDVIQPHSVLAVQPHRYDRYAVHTPQHQAAS